MHLKQKNRNYIDLSNAKESKNSPTDGEWVRPQALDQSYKVVKISSISLAIGVSWLSKVRLFLSLQIVHIRQEGIKFQTSEDLFPNQFHHPNSNSRTQEGITHSIPTNWKTKLYNCLAAPQCNKRWSTDSSAFLHIQHQPAKTKPLCFKLSQVRMRRLGNDWLPSPK